MSGQRMKPGRFPPDPVIWDKERIEQRVREYNERFAALSEDEQIIHLHCGEVHRAYEIYDSSGKAREDTARECLSKRLGQKFVERILAIRHYRDILKVDVQPDLAEHTATVVSTI